MSAGKAIRFGSAFYSGLSTQAVVRHSTITLTMDRYWHTILGDQSEALADENLPENLLFSGGLSRALMDAKRG